MLRAVLGSQSIGGGGGGGEPDGSGEVYLGWASKPCPNLNP